MAKGKKSLDIDNKLSTDPNLKIVLDSNIFLNYLWATKEEFEVFLKIVSDHKEEIIFTEQSLDELKRNLPLNFETNKSNRIDCFDIPLKAESLKFVTQKQRGIINQAIQITKENKDNQKKSYDENKNKLNKFLGEINSSDFILIERTEDIVRRAIIRKHIGNPPVSDKKTTVGDEIIWESLLSWNKANIIIVTRDNGFLNNKEFLTEEFKCKTDFNLIDIYDELDLSNALERLKVEDKNKALDKLKEIESSEKLNIKQTFVNSLYVPKLDILEDIAKRLNTPEIREFLESRNELNKKIKPLLNYLQPIQEQHERIVFHLKEYEKKFKDDIAIHLNDMKDEKVDKGEKE